MNSHPLAFLFRCSVASSSRTARLLRGVRLAVGLCAAALLGCAADDAARKTAPGALPVAAGEDLNPKLNATTYFAHGHLLERQGNFADAARQYRQALTLKPDFVTARNRLGITLNKLGQHAEATAEFRKAVAQQPDQTHLQNNLGFSLYLEGKYTEAERLFQQTLEMKPTFTRARLNRALALAKLQRFDEALAELRQCGPEAEAYYNLAMMQAEAARYAEAAQSLDMALRLNPTFEPARQQLREIAKLASQQTTPTVAETVTPGAPTFNTITARPSAPANTANPNTITPSASDNSAGVSAPSGAETSHAPATPAPAPSETTPAQPPSAAQTSVEPQPSSGTQTAQVAPSEPAAPHSTPEPAAPSGSHAVSEPSPQSSESAGGESPETMVKGAVFERGPGSPEHPLPFAGDMAGGWETDASQEAVAELSISEPGAHGTTVSETSMHETTVNNPNSANVSDHAGEKTSLPNMLSALRLDASVGLAMDGVLSTALLNNLIEAILHGTEPLDEFWCEWDKRVGAQKN